MNILIAPDSFKESLSAREVADHIEKGILRVFPGANCIKVPLGDGGEGTVDALVAATGGQIKRVTVKDPLMRDIESFFGILGDGKTGVIEMAAASGLALLKQEERDPMKTTSYGTGQLIEAAMESGCTTIIAGIGGSATNDGGAGMAGALGFSLIGKNGMDLEAGGGNLSQLRTIDTGHIHRGISKTAFIVASDVRNTLCGENGASAIYGPQKGATPAMIAELDKNLYHFGKMLEKKFSVKVIDMPGAGAAGGLGAGLVAFLGASMQTGFDILKKFTRLEEKMTLADLVITGEGRLDHQTKFGKTPAGVARLAKKLGKPVIAISGSLGAGYRELYHEGFDSIFSLTEGPVSLDDACKNAPEYLRNTTERIFRLLNLEFKR